MNGGYSQFARVLESLTPITTRPVVPEHAETYLNCTADEWVALMKLKYPDQFLSDANRNG
jgi:hypothetical protein